MRGLTPKNCQLLVILMIACLTVEHMFAQVPVAPIKAGSKIFIEEMDQDLDGYIRAEIVKQKVSLLVVFKVEEADYIMKGSATEEERRKWHEGWLTTERDKTSGNIFVTDPKGERLIWASEAGDRSIWWGVLKRGGHRKVADRLVHNLRKAISR